MSQIRAYPVVVTGLLASSGYDKLCQAWRNNALVQFPKRTAAYKVLGIETTIDQRPDDRVTGTYRATLLAVEYGG